ncbi:TRAP transporter large permease [Falsiroseomonas sp. HW251]|uniref:TRAP transporter large permease n=1 Tax=Falsiroseomonas sp. HW251 TaxID=3390998 RepID=UPI003D31703D
MTLAFVLLMALLALGVPIAFALGIAPLVTLADRGIPFIALPQIIFEATDSFVLLAVPLFILSGLLMQSGGIAARLVELAVALLGWLRGGLAASVVLTSMMFSTISGSSAATAAAVGSVLIPQMKRSNYPTAFAAATVASSAELGVIIPPSVPMVIYAMLTGISVTDLFIAGILPGILIGVSLIVTCVVLSALRGYGEVEPFRLGPWTRGVAVALRRAWAAVMMPVIILGGIYGGIFTPTEAAVVAVFYALLVGTLVYGELQWREVPGILRQAAVTSAVVMIIVSFTAILAYVLALLRAPDMMLDAIRAVSDDPLVFLLLVNILLLLVGIFFEPLPAILILGPLLHPVAVGMGIDPTHFGLILIVNTAIGMVTPPVGANLFISCAIARISMEELSRPLLVFLAVLTVDILIITYVPALSLALL